MNREPYIGGIGLPNRGPAFPQVVRAHATADHQPARGDRGRAGQGDEYPRDLQEARYDQARKLQELESEVARLNRLVADLKVSNDHLWKVARRDS
jgi:hypothetical protein